MIRQNAAMPRRVFLHIGTPKSGTTYLQERWRLSRDVLAEQGLTYPQLRRATDHFEGALDLIERPWAGELTKARGQWQALAALANKAPQDALISHEILAAARPEQVARAMDSFGEAEVHVILTVRDLARQIPAEWQESIKHRNVRKFNGFMRRVLNEPRTSPSLWFWRVQSVPDVLNRWSSGLPPERVHVVTVPQRGAPRTLLWDRMCSVLGLDPSLQYADTEETNASLGIAEVDMLRRLNRRLRDHDVSRDTYVPMVREFIVREILGSDRRSQPPALPTEYWPFVEEVTQEWLEWLEGSGVDIVGDLDELRPVRPEKEPPHPDHPRQAAVTRAAIECLAAVLAEIDEAPLKGVAGNPVRRIGRKLKRS